MPTVCSETCVGRLRHLGVVLYDSDRVEEAASVPDEHDLHESQLGIFLDPEDPDVRAQAARDGVPDDWVEAARRSPVYNMAVRWRIALPLHPEFRTLPMVWYVPPLSPVMSLIEDVPPDEVPAETVFGAIDELRIPVQYLANLLTAGNAEPVRLALRRMAAMRTYMRGVTVDGAGDPSVPAAVGMDEPELKEMYRQVAIGDYDDRYVIPRAHPEAGADPAGMQGSCGLSFASGTGAGSPATPREGGVDGLQLPMVTHHDPRGRQ
jgi:nitrate reductase beta subunit